MSRVCDKAQDPPVVMMWGNRRESVDGSVGWAQHATKSLNNDPLIPSLGVYHKERVQVYVYRHVHRQTVIVED